MSALTRHARGRPAFSLLELLFATELCVLRFHSSYAIVRLRSLRGELSRSGEGVCSGALPERYNLAG